eukprot:1593446-Amphidinium_carterae.2
MDRSRSNTVNPRQAKPTAGKRGPILHAQLAQLELRFPPINFIGDPIRVYHDEVGDVASGMHAMDISTIEGSYS